MSIAHTTLVRGLGLVAVTSLVVGNVIGTGVFLKSRVMTCNVGTPGRVILVWIVAGLLSLAGALSYAELASRWPRAGGEYVFLREAYSARLAFLFGWMRFFVASAGSVAALSVGFAIFLNVLLGGSLNVTFFTLPGLQVGFGGLQLAALIAIAFVTLINCASVSFGGRFASAVTAIKVGIIIALAAGAYLLAPGDWSHFFAGSEGGVCEGVTADERVGATGFAAAMLGALWAYNGWNEMTFVAGEVKRPERNIPLALVGGMAIVCALYVLVNTSYFYVLTPVEIASVPADSSVAAVAAQRFVGPVAVSFIAIAMLTSTFGALQISSMSSARVPYAMARDGLFLQSLARVSDRTHVPIRALVAQAIWAGVLALSGSYDRLTDYVIFANWIFFGLVVASVFIIRRRVRESDHAFRAWGYPIVPVLFLIMTGWLLLTTMASSPVRSLIGIVLVAIGIPVYYFQSRKATSG
jgi:APA family basic amino acid/polyamine antiporter